MRFAAGCAALCTVCVGLLGLFRHDPRNYELLTLLDKHPERAFDLSTHPIAVMLTMPPQDKPLRSIPDATYTFCSDVAKLSVSSARGTHSGVPETSVVPPNVLLFVLDTVRRDHVSICPKTHSSLRSSGADLTPHLTQLAARGTTYCGMVTPGSWTLPTHASIFTGLLPTEHHADFRPPAQASASVRGLSISAMDTSVSTLAELFLQAGYSTAIVSGNPVLTEATGVLRAFERRLIARNLHAGSDATSAPKLRALVESQVATNKPLFLFVNIIIAHGPFEPAPEGNHFVASTQNTIGLITQSV